MRIIIKELSDGGANIGETILCDGASKGQNLWMGPDGMVLDGAVEPQVQGFLRAASVKVWNRRNHRISVSFRCSRDCGTTQEAESYIVQFYATCRRSNQLAIISSLPGGGTSQLRINNAVLQSLKLTHVGVLVRAEFSLVGGSISS
jgi:hypothetical protein